MSTSIAIAKIRQNTHKFSEFRQEYGPISVFRPFRTSPNKNRKTTNSQNQIHN